MGIEEIIEVLEATRLIAERKCEREKTGTQVWQSCNDRSIALREAITLLRTHRSAQENPGEVSDGYHTFNELYHHRAVLFSVICNEHPDLAWKSKLHADGTMYDGMFIVGIETPDGQATYHYNLDPYWDMFKVKELECAPKWDGHTPAQAIERIGRLSQNDLLTLEELRERTKPVFVKVKGFPGGGYWCLCQYGYIMPPNGIGFWAKDRRSWELYDRPPKED